jgi:putative tricarboxylic transport membrane protein
MEFLKSLLDLYGSSFYMLGDISNWLILLFGTGLGVLCGALPGLTSTMALVVCTPLTFAMEPGPAFLLLMGLYVGSVFGGAISAVCINIPGTPAAMVTTLDGYPLGQKGEAGKAVTVATMSSVVGGLIGLFILMLGAPFLAYAVKFFGSWEYCAVAFFGLSIVSFISEGPVVNGFIGGCIGLFLATVGLDPVSGAARFTGGGATLMSGFDNIVIMIGVFGVTEILVYVSKNDQLQIIQNLKMDVKNSIMIMLKNRINIIRSSLIGILIGIVPAAGGGVGSVVAYGIAKQTSKTPEKFGTGHYPGIVASESANNSSVGGALLPMMTLGIPGDPMTAVLIGALMLQGLTPGPLLFENSPEVVSAIFIGLGITTIFLLIWGILGGNLFARALSIPAHFLYPVVLLLCLVGSYVLRYNFFDIFVLVVFGLAYFFLRKIKISALPMILGLILGGMVEENFRRCVMLSASQNNPFLFLSRPVAVIFILISIVLLITGAIQTHRLNKKQEECELL